MLLRRIEWRFKFCYHWRAIYTTLLRSIVVNMSHKKKSHLMISFNKHHHLHFFVHVSSIKAGTEVVEYLSWHKIERRFRFCYHRRAIYTALVRSIKFNTSQKNHSHLMILFSNHHHLYSFVHISSIKAGTEVVEYLSLCGIKQICRFFYHCRAINTALVQLIVINMCQQKNSHLIISFSNHHHMYSFVHRFSIKAGAEVVEDFSLCIIEQRFQFCYHWRDIDTALVCSIALTESNWNHSK